jgi:DNA invertase Pin-like site-specific DNA recombinase
LLDNGPPMNLSQSPSASRVVRLIKAGATIAAAAEECGLHRSAVYRRMLACGIRTARSWAPLTKRERQEILRLLEADKSRREVAEITGRGLGTVARIAVQARDDDSDVTRLKTAVRCPDCGNRITVRPCLICAARRRCA